MLAGLKKDLELQLVTRADNPLQFLISEAFGFNFHKDKHQINQASVRGGFFLH